MFYVAIREAGEFVVATCITFSIDDIALGAPLTFEKMVLTSWIGSKRRGSGSVSITEGKSLSFLVGLIRASKQRHLQWGRQLRWFILDSLLPGSISGTFLKARRSLV